MRFRKRVKIFPGFSLNFSGSGVSTTVGPRGANINFSKRGTYFNGSIPGTGLYDRFKIGGVSPSSSPSLTPPILSPDILDDIIQPVLLDGSLKEIKSGEIEEMTSSSLLELKETLAEAYIDLNTLPLEIEEVRKKWVKAKNLQLLSKLFLFGFFTDIFKIKVEDRLFDLESMNDQLANTYVGIDIHFDEQTSEKYNELRSAFDELSGCQFLWDKTSSSSVDIRMRSAAGTSITREKVTFRIEDIPAIKSTYPGLCLENRNGGDIYIYPGFIIMIDQNKNFALIDVHDLSIKGTVSKFLEEETIPSDAENIGMTWAKVNNDGSRDRRFVGNYQIPILRYGVFNVKSPTGLEESYMASNWNAVQRFCEAFDAYQKITFPNSKPSLK